MTTQPHQARQPSGSPVGGQFATTERSEADVDLAPPTSAVEPEADALDPDPFLTPEPEFVPPTGGKGGRWEVDDASTREEPSRTPGVRSTLVAFGGFPEARNRNRAAATIYRSLADGNGDIEERLHDLAAKRAKVTILRAASSGNIRADECTLLLHQGRLAMLPKGARSNGFLLDADQVIDVTPGYGGQNALAQTWQRRKAQFTPALVEIDGYDDLPLYAYDPETGEPPSDISAVYMVDQPNFDGGTSPGCLFLATDWQPGEGPGDRDIINGYFWAPAGSGLESEHGSVYADDLKHRGAKVRDYQPGSMTFRDCWTAMPENMAEGFRRVLGHTWVSDA